MTCCGSGREALRTGSSPSPAATTPAVADGPVLLKPRGPMTLYARGVTGRRYVFNARGGARPVHPADVPGLLASGQLRIAD